VAFSLEGRELHVAGQTFDPDRLVAADEELDKSKDREEKTGMPPDCSSPSHAESDRYEQTQ
jgi:hypothetical protein